MGPVDDSVTTDTKSQSHKAKLPPIRILLARGPSDITIRISDQGGGVSKRHLPHVFAFGFSTVFKKPDVEEEVETFSKRRKSCI
jgi:sensor histidine kinase regulating citrate/malate metabolism